MSENLPMCSENSGKKKCQTNMQDGCPLGYSVEGVDISTGMGFMGGYINCLKNTEPDKKDEGYDYSKRGGGGYGNIRGKGGYTNLGSYRGLYEKPPLINGIVLGNSVGTVLGNGAELETGTVLGNGTVKRRHRRRCRFDWRCKLLIVI